MWTRLGQISIHPWVQLEDTDASGNPSDQDSSAAGRFAFFWAGGAFVGLVGRALVSDG